MKKVLKIVSVTLIVIILVLALLPLLFKSKIEKEVKNQINQNVNAKVDFKEVSISLITTFPNLSFGIEQLSVTGVGEFDSVNIASIKEMSLKINLMSLVFSNAIEVKSILIDELNVHALVLPSGVASWDIVKTSDEEKPEEVKDESKQATDFKLKLKSLVIKNTNIIYDDKPSNIYASIDDLYFSLNGDFSQNRTVLNTQIDIAKLFFKESGITLVNKAVLDIDASVDADLENMKFKLSENTFRLNELALKLDGWVSYLDEVTNMDISLSTKKTSFKSILSLVPVVYLHDFSQVKTKGNIELKLDAKGKYLKDHYPSFDLVLDIDKASFKYPDLPKSADNIEVHLESSSKGGGLDNIVVNLKKLHLDIASNPFDMNFFAQNLISNPKIKGAITTHLNIESLKDVVPLEKGDKLSGIIDANVALNGELKAIEEERYEDFQAKGTVIAQQVNYSTSALDYDVFLDKMELEFSPRYVNLKNLSAKIKESDFHLSGKIKNFIGFYLGKDSILDANYTLTSNYINANDFMEPEEENTSPKTPEEKTEVEEEPMTVAEVPEKIAATFTTKIKKLKYSNSIIENISGFISVRDRRANLENFSLNMLGGKVMTSGFYETVIPNKPGISFKLDVKKIDIVRLQKEFVTMKKLSTLSKYSNGKFDVSMFVEGSLDSTMSPDLNTLSGNGRLKTQSFYVKGYPPLEALGTALKRKDLTEINLSNTHISFTFKDGRVSVAPFDVKVGNLSANVSGSSGFDKSIDYKVKMKLPTSALGLSDIANQATREANKYGLNLKGMDYINVTGRVEGTVTKPKIKLDYKSISSGVKSVAKTAIKEAVKEVKNRALDAAKKEADKLVKNARKEAERLIITASRETGKLRDEAENQATNIINQTSNPFAKAAAKIAAQKILKAANKKIDKINQKARQQADKIIQSAKDKADKKIENAKRK